MLCAGFATRMRPLTLSTPKPLLPVAGRTILDHLLDRLTATGAIDEMLGKIAEFYDEEVESTTEQLTALIEPLMIAFLGGVVGSMIVALYMPIFKVFDLIS